MILSLGIAIDSARHLFPPKTHLILLGMSSCVAQGEGLLALQPRITERAVPFPALGPTQNWQPFMLPDKWIEAMVLSVKSPSKDFALFLVVGSMRLSTLPVTFGSGYSRPQDSS